MGVIVRREKHRDGYFNVIRTHNGVLLRKERWNSYGNTTINFKKRVMSDGVIKIDAPKGYKSYATVLKNVVEKVTMRDSITLSSIERSPIMKKSKIETEDTFHAIITGTETRSRKPKGRYQYVVKLRLKRGYGDGEGYVFGRSRASPLADKRVLSHDEMRYEAWENALGRLYIRLYKTASYDTDDTKMLLDSHISSFQEGYVRYSKA